MRYLVTGGAGFIGSHIVEALIGHGHSVRVLDDFSSGSRANLEPVRGSSLLDVVEGDVRDAKLVDHLATGVDGIFHQAGLVSVQKSLECPALSFDVNVGGSVVVLESAWRAGVKRVVLASSAAVYGNGKHVPVSEHNPTCPLTPYALDKSTMEHYAAQYRRLYGLETIVLRYFNVYGSRQLPSSPYSGVITLFLDRIHRGEEITVYGDGEQTRDFVHVLDVVHANLRAMNAANNGFGIYNVGTGCETGINRLIGILTKIMDRRVPVTHKPPRTGDIRQSCADIARARAELDYQPQRDLPDGLRSLVRNDESCCIAGRR